MGNGGKKILKKQLVIVGIAVILIFVGLSGCNEVSNPLASDESKFVGTWKYESSFGNATFIFFSDDGTCNYFGSGSLWEIKDGKLVFTMVQSTMTEVLDYEFSNSDNTLTVTNLEYNKIYVFTRKQ